MKQPSFAGVELKISNSVSSEMRTCRRGERYDPETHGCCRGAATTVYEKRRHLCHIGVLYKKTDPQQNAVCIFFDANTEQRKAIPFAKNPKTVSSITIFTSQSHDSELIARNCTSGLQSKWCHKPRATGSQMWFWHLQHFKRFVLW